MSGHTPGPWWASVTREVFNSNRRTVCRAHLDGNRVSRDEALANAHLIAAAPELYVALIAAKQELWLSARLQWTMADFKNWAVVQQIDAALEKADGKPRTADAVARTEQAQS